MPTLPYQHGGDAAREQRKQFRLQWFGPSRAEVWKRLAEEIGARYRQRSFLKSDRVTAEVGNWEIVLDVFRTDKVCFTRIRAPFVNVDGFRFKIFRKHFLSGVAEMLGFQDISIGRSDFDEQFVIRGNHEGKLRRLLSNSEIRRLLMAQPKICFEVKDDEGLFRQKFPEGVDELRFMVSGVIKDIDRLKELYDLFAETLQMLCEMGEAYDRDPGVEL